MAFSVTLRRVNASVFLYFVTLPRYLLKERAQLPAAFRVNYLHVRDATQQVLAKVGMVDSILAAWAVANAVCQDCF